MSGLETAVLVPGLEASRCVIELHEADAPLDEASSQETLAAEHFRRRLVEPIHLASRRGFTREIESFGGLGLHPKGEFKRFDAGAQSVVVFSRLAV